jgi:Co/Zn/Cd efflux system component
LREYLNMHGTNATVDQRAPSGGTAGLPVALLVILGLSAILGIAFVAVVTPGIPYDEPSHWLNVLYYANHHWIPTIGDPSVSYEAQQPPLAYAIAGIVAGPVRHLATLRAAFYAIRIVGGVEWLVTLVFAWRILGRLLPDGSIARSVAFAFLALNPMLIAMSWSVQNDSLALLLGFGAIDYASAEGRRSFGTLQGAVLGAIVAAGILTKLTDWALVVAFPIWLLMPAARRPWKAIAAFVGSLAVLSGWWFVRNMALYGDPLGRGKAAAAAGGFAPYPLHGIGNLAHAAQNVVTYLWLPTEYWRSIIHAPAALKGLILAITVVVLAIGAIVHVRDRRQAHDADAVGGAGSGDTWADTWSLVVITGAIALVAWVFLFFGWSALAPRLAYLALPLWAALVGLTAQAVGAALPRIRPALPSAALVIMVALCVWSLHAVHSAEAALHLIADL